VLKFASKGNITRDEKFRINVAPTFIQIVLTGVVAMIAIAGGLAFGLGGKELAADWMRRVRDEMK